MSNRAWAWTVNVTVIGGCMGCAKAPCLRLCHPGDGVTDLAVGDAVIAVPPDGMGGPAKGMRQRDRKPLPWPVVDRGRRPKVVDEVVCHNGFRAPAALTSGSFCTTDARWVYAAPSMSPEEAVAGRMGRQIFSDLGRDAFFFSHLKHHSFKL
ncbi:unnamed protein product [Symbiodinium natans]|uniref:Uncharacterized protein n=1 Tax=Symbiodinium natans TaxID=878477 RepID=A0A812IDG1_9DINO|nr:unnamed protein product [Symbiodinium natans]